MEHWLPQWERNSSFESHISGHSKKLQSLFLIFLSFLCSALSAQTTISGRVTAGDTALSGVTVQVKGTNTTTQTATAGTFTINAASNANLGLYLCWLCPAGNKGK